MLPQRQDRPFVAALLGLVLACAASCGGSSSDPKSLPPITPSATSSSSTPTASPTDSKKAELAAATAVVRKYYKLLNNLSHNNVPHMFAEIEAPGCNCRGFLSNLRQVKSKNEHYFGQAHLTALRPSLDNPRVAEVLVAYDSTAGGVADANGHVVTRAAPIHGAALNFRLSRQGGVWRIYRVDLIRQGRS